MLSKKLKFAYTNCYCIRNNLLLVHLQSRAKQLYTAGYRQVEDVARAKARDLVAKVEYLSMRVANQLISAAKVMLFEKLENLHDEAQDLRDICAA